MNKLQFTKYLPVEGDIDTTSEQHHFFDDSGELHQMNRSYALSYKRSWKLAKLFLCSIDLKIGDTVYNSRFHPYPNGWKLKSTSDVMDAHMLAGDTEEESLTYKVIREVDDGNQY